MTCRNFNYQKIEVVNWNLMVAPTTRKASWCKSQDICNLGSNQCYQ
jgi:hypothetical protein